MSQINQHSHLGVYAIIQTSDQIALIEKSRGPYTGMLDLPGGSIEFGESPEETVIREVKEETGLNVTSCVLSEAISTNFEYAKNDGDYVLHHLGIIYNCYVQSVKVNTEGDGLDSGGAGWYTFNSIDVKNLTPFAKKAVIQCKKEFSILKNEDVLKRVSTDSTLKTLNDLTDKYDKTDTLLGFSPKVLSQSGKKELLVAINSNTPYEHDEYTWAIPRDGHIYFTCAYSEGKTLKLPKKEYIKLLSVPRPEFYAEEDDIETHCSLLFHEQYILAAKKLETLMLKFEKDELLISPKIKRLEKIIDQIKTHELNKA